MEIQQLRYFIKTAEVLHFTKAAELCFVTQSGLSQQIKKLEEELGMPLFFRVGKRVQLTEAGRIFLQHAKRIVDDVVSGKQAIDDLNNLIGGELRIGVTYIFGLLIVPVVQSFAKMYPELKIIIENGVTEQLEQKLVQNQLDLVLGISGNEIDVAVRKVPLFSSKLVLAVAKSNPLALLESIPFKRLEEFALILPSKGFSSRGFIDNLFEELNMKPKISIELNAIHSLLQIVESGDWVTVLNEKALKGWENIKAVDFEGVQTERESFILTMDNAYQKKAVNLFIEAFRVYFISI